MAPPAERPQLRVVEQRLDHPLRQPVPTVLRVHDDVGEPGERRVSVTAQANRPRRSVARRNAPTHRLLRTASSGDSRRTPNDQYDSRNAPHVVDAGCAQPQADLVVHLQARFLGRLASGFAASASAALRRVDGFDDVCRRRRRPVRRPLCFALAQKPFTWRRVSCSQAEPARGTTGTAGLRTRRTAPAMTVVNAASSGRLNRMQVRCRVSCRSSSGTGTALARPASSRARRSTGSGGRFGAPRPRRGAASGRSGTRRVDLVRHVVADHVVLDSSSIPLVKVCTDDVSNGGEGLAGVHSAAEARYCSGVSELGSHGGIVRAVAGGRRNSRWRWSVRGRTIAP